MRNRVCWTMAATAALAIAMALAVPAKAQGVRYEWRQGDAPPANVVTGAGGRKRPICSFHSTYGEVLGASFNGTCNADLSGNRLAGTQSLKFLVAASGPAGGRWAETGIYETYPTLPKGFVRHLAPRRYGDRAVICSLQGSPGIAYVFGSAWGPTGAGAQSCAVGEQWDGAQPRMWVLMGGE